MEDGVEAAVKVNMGCCYFGGSEAATVRDGVFFNHDEVPRGGRVGRVEIMLELEEFLASQIKREMSRCG